MSETKIRDLQYACADRDAVIADLKLDKDVQAARIAELEAKLDPDVDTPEWDYQECMRQYDHQQERAYKAEARIAELEADLESEMRSTNEYRHQVDDRDFRIAELEARLAHAEKGGRILTPIGEMQLTIDIQAVRIAELEAVIGSETPIDGLTLYQTWKAEKQHMMEYIAQLEGELAEWTAQYKGALTLEEINQHITTTGKSIQEVKNGRTGI